MEWNNDITGELPAPRNDEPEHLRKDIADELSDHLQCALNRELHSTQNEQQAKQNVLSRFGNVNRIARQLWFDCMKEKIMSQRLTLAMMAVMAAVCVVLCLLIWNVAQSNRETNLALVEQSRAMNQNILDKLAALSKPAPAPEPARSYEWNPLKVHLVKGQAGGPPAEGFQVQLRGNILNETKLIRVTQTSGADGIADFGLVRLGAHTLTITTPWNENRSLSITLRPGEEHIEEIICPAEPLPQFDFKISVEWPEDLKDKKLWAVCQFSYESRKIDQDYWSYSNPSRIVISPKGEMVSFSRIQRSGSLNIYSDSSIETLLKQIQDGPITSPDQEDPIKSPVKGRSVRSAVRRQTPLGRLKSMQRNMGGLTASGISGEFSPQLTWAGKKATLTSLGVGLLPAGEPRGNDIRLMYARNYPVESRRIGSSRGGVFGISRGSFSESPTPAEWPAEEREFVLEPGRVNEWKIVLPEWLLKRIRLSMRVAEAVNAQEQAG